MLCLIGDVDKWTRIEKASEEEAAQRLQCPHWEAHSLERAGTSSIRPVLDAMQEIVMHLSRPLVKDEGRL